MNDDLQDLLKQFIEQYPYLCVEPEDRELFTELMVTAYTKGFEDGQKNTQ